MCAMLSPRVCSVPCAFTLFLLMHAHIAYSDRAANDSAAKAIIGYDARCFRICSIKHQCQAYLSAVSFDASPSGPHAIAAVPQTAPEPSTNQHSSSSLQAHDSSFTSAAASTMRTEHTAPPRHSAAAQHDSASMSRKPSSSLSTGSRAPSLLTAAQNLSTNSLSSLASGSAAAANARSPSPASEYVGSRADMGEAEIEAQKLRRQIHQMETWHEEESRKRSADHDANVAAVQAQAVAKMKELIEKVGQ